MFGGRRVVLFGLPGAFTGMCSTQHLPSFIRVADALRAKGVDEVVCVAVNDPFVMRVWGRRAGPSRRGSGCSRTCRRVHRAARDMTFDNPPRGLIGRSRRYALLAEDGVVRVLNVETSRTDCEISGGETMLAAV